MENKTRNQINRKRKLIKKQERRKNKKTDGENAFGKEIHQGWHKISSEPIEDLEAYIYNYIVENKDHKIELLIGTDGISYGNASVELNKNSSTLKLLTVLCFVKPGKGTHVIKRREKKVLNYNISTAEKLNSEINKTYEFAMYLKNLQLKFEVHLDLNMNADHDSFNVYNTIKGFFESLDIITRYKPIANAASSAADYFI